MVVFNLAKYPRVTREATHDKFSTAIDHQVVTIAPTTCKHVPRVCKFFNSGASVRLWLILQLLERYRIEKRKLRVLAHPVGCIEY
jgi:hypothetical protein